MQVEDIAKVADNKQALMLIHKGKYKSEIVRAQIYDQTYHICICIKIDLIYPPFSLDQSRFVNLMSFGELLNIKFHIMFSGFTIVKSRMRV